MMGGDDASYLYGWIQGVQTDNGANKGLYLNPLGGSVLVGAAIGVALTSTSALVDIAASTTSIASLRIRSGTAPTSPNDGDIWFDGTDLKMRIGGVTKTFTLV
jgi:hypothetical protein